jgi:hypothetical protein
MIGSGASVIPTQFIEDAVNECKEKLADATLPLITFVTDKLVNVPTLVRLESTTLEGSVVPVSNEELILDAVSACVALVAFATVPVTRDPAIDEAVNA